MRSNEKIKTLILSLVTGSMKQRLRPFTLEQTVMRKTGASLDEVKRALNELMREEELVYSYRDPCSYVEVPVIENLRSA
jgi:hypothetical protein